VSIMREKERSDAIRRESQPGEVRVTDAVIPAQLHAWGDVGRGKQKQPVPFAPENQITPECSVSSMIGPNAHGLTTSSCLPSIGRWVKVLVGVQIFYPTSNPTHLDAAITVVFILVKKFVFVVGPTDPSSVLAHYFATE